MFSELAKLKQEVGLSRYAYYFVILWISEHKLCHPLVLEVWRTCKVMIPKPLASLQVEEKI